MKDEAPNVKHAPPSSPAFRRDVEVQARRDRGRRVWTLKDPLALRYYQLSDEEFWLYRSLDGRTTPDRLREAFERRFAPRRLEANMLQGFLLHLRREGLTVVDAPGEGEALLARRRAAQRERRRTWWTKLFAWRMRGVDPEPWLRRLEPALRRLLSATTLLAIGALVAAAAVLAVAHVRRGGVDAVYWQSLFDPSRAVWILPLLGVVKIVHELGHAAACKRFGGECHEIGFMLFLFAPSLYCNVTDTWMLPNKWARAAVGAAGIVVELTLAAVAALLWIASEPGTFHDACALVMVACGVNSLLLNGNPLLRYDGYHVLADVWEVPNLAARAGDVWRRWGTRLWFGRATAAALYPPASRGAPANELALAAYAAASFLYVIVVVAAALLLFVRWAEQWRLEALAYPIVTAAVVAMAVFPAARGLRRLGDPIFAQGRGRPRFRIVTAAVGLPAAAALFVPLPRSLYVVGTLRPVGARGVYVAQSGFLRDIGPPRLVVRDEIVAELVDPDLAQEIVRLESEFEAARLRLQLLERRGTSADDTSIDLPTARQAAADARSRLEARRDDARRLTLRAPVAGRLFEPPRRRAAADDLDTLPTWTGSPFDAENRGAYLAAGTTVCVVGDPRRVEASAVIDDADILAVSLGADAEILADVAANRRLVGTVVEAGAADAPRHDPAASHDPIAGETQEPAALGGERFRVRIEIPGDAGPVTIDAPVRIRIAARSESLAAKLYRWTTQTFRFR